MLTWVLKCRFEDFQKKGEEIRFLVMEFVMMIFATIKCDWRKVESQGELRREDEREQEKKRIIANILNFENGRDVLCT